MTILKFTRSQNTKCNLFPFSGNKLQKRIQKMKQRQNPKMKLHFSKQPKSKTKNRKNNRKKIDEKSFETRKK